MDSNWVDFDAIKQVATVRAVLDHYGIQDLKQHGEELRGRCPIHQGDGERSFHIHTGKKAFFCFSCQAKGNLIDFVAAMERCSFRDAALRLQDWLGLAPRSAPQPPRPTPKPAVSGARVDGSSLTGQSPESNTSLELAREKRGEKCSSVANQPLNFQLKGIDHGHEYLAGRGISKETAEHFGVGFFPGKGSMARRVVIPIHNPDGELVAYAGRSLDGSEPRYKLPAGVHKSQVVYNLHRAIATGERGLIVVEGFFDCMKVHQAGYPFVVGLMGCTMSEKQVQLLAAHADMLLVMLDGDEAGRKGTDEILLRLGRRLWVKSVEVPEGLQPDRMTAEEIQELLKR